MVEPERRSERKQRLFKSPGSAQRFLNVQSCVYNTFYVKRHLLRRTMFKRLRRDAFSAWENAGSAGRKNADMAPYPCPEVNVTTRGYDACACVRMVEAARGIRRQSFQTSLPFANKAIAYRFPLGFRKADHLLHRPMLAQGQWRCKVYR